MFGDESAIGRHFLGGPPNYQIVGIVENGKYEMLTEDPDAGDVFSLWDQEHEANTILIVRSESAAFRVAGALNRVLTGD